MSLPLPRLDNRDFDELVRTAIREIPHRAPGWTDHNAHDPGVTLVELFAWLVEMDLFRLDRTPPELARAYLRLVGVEVASARSAMTWVTLHHPTSSALPAGIQLGGGDRLFETMAPLAISPARLVALRAERDGRAQDLLAQNEQRAPYAPLGEEGRSDLVLAFDQPLGVGQTVALYLWTGNDEEDAATRAALIAEHARALDDDCPEEPPSPWEHYGVRVVWEYRSSLGWRPLPDIDDETRALSLSGPVRFSAPADQASVDGTFDLRARVVSGRYDCVPHLVHLGINAVATIHAAAIASSDSLGTSTGRAGQSFALAEGPSVPASFALTVGAAPWLEVATWDRSGPHDQHFVVDRERGTLSFGNGRVGAVPPADQPIEARYALGAGTEGNVARDTLDHAPVNAQNTSLVPGFDNLAPQLEVRQPGPAFGGADAERLVAAQGRAVAHLERPVRATTLLDIERLALETPGVPVARARAIAERMAALPCLAAAGAVTLVVVPRCFEGLPLPTPALCRAVRRHLRPRLPVATELFVVGPQLTKVSVKARLVLEPNAPSIGVGESARQALATFLDPLRGGPDGDGWPVGRGVHRTEIYELLNGLPCVAWVEGLAIATVADAPPRYGDCTCCSGACECGCRSADSWLCGDLVVCEDSILVSGTHHIDVVDRRELR